MRSEGVRNALEVRRETGCDAASGKSIADAGRRRTSVGCGIEGEAKDGETRNGQR